MKLTTKQIKQMIKEELMEMAYDPYGDPGMKRRRSIKYKLRGKQGTIDINYAKQLAGELKGDFYWNGRTSLYEIVLKDGLHISYSKVYIPHRPQKRSGWKGVEEATFVFYGDGHRTYGIMTGVTFPLSGDPRVDGRLIDILRNKHPEEIKAIHKSQKNDWIESAMPGFPERYIQ